VTIDVHGHAHARVVFRNVLCLNASHLNREAHDRVYFEPEFRTQGGYDFAVLQGNVLYCLQVTHGHKHDLKLWFMRQLLRRLNHLSPGCVERLVVVFVVPKPSEFVIPNADLRAEVNVSLTVACFKRADDPSRL
jgi:hypothetical protein